MTDNIIITTMTVKDLPEAIKLWSISFKAGYSSGFDTAERLTLYLKRNPGLSSVAKNSKGELIGALLAGHDGRRGSIYHTAVYPQYRGKGIGRTLQERSINALKKEGITTGFLMISTHNPGSREFWENTGWKVIDHIRYLYKEF